MGTCQRLLAHVPANRAQCSSRGSKTSMEATVPEWPGNELRQLPRPPSLKQRPERMNARTITQHSSDPRFCHLVVATRPDPARCQEDGTAETSGCNGSGSDDSTAGSYEPSKNVGDTAGHKKRARPGPVPKLEHMTLQNFQEGGYFDMQIQEATAKLGVGRTVLTRRVRQLGISRWPCRRRASMRKLIAKTHNYLDHSGTERQGRQPPTHSIVDMLHAEMDPCKGARDEVLRDAIWKYRQCFFKQEHLAKSKVATSHARSGTI